MYFELSGYVVMCCEYCCNPSSAVYESEEANTFFGIIGHPRLKQTRIYVKREMCIY